MHSGCRSPLQLESAIPDLPTSSSDASVSNSPHAPLCGASDRETLISALFREADRAQRMNTPLTLLALAIHDPATSRDSTERESVLAQAIQRTICSLRSYDLTGQIGDGDFLIALPGCDTRNAIKLAQRLRNEVARVQVQSRTNEVRFSTCFGIAASNGRSPLIVLREAKEALNEATRNGPGSICCYSICSQPETAPVAFLASLTNDESL